MGGKLSPPMERLIFRAVLAQRDPVEFCNKSVYTNLSSLIKYVSHATHMIPLLLLFRDETVKYSPYKYVYAHASEFQKYICPPVLFFYFILPTRWKYYSCYFFFFLSFPFPSKIRITIVLDSLFVSTRRVEENLSSRIYVPQGRRYIMRSRFDK